MSRRRNLTEERRERKERQDKISATSLTKDKDKSRENKQVDASPTKKVSAPVNYTVKYGLKILKNQFHKNVPENYMDETERNQIEKFVECCENLKKQNKDKYIMIELGSNQAYYSLLFKAILGEEKTKAIMVESIKSRLGLGQAHFTKNGYSGIFLHRAIGNNWSTSQGHNPDGPPQLTTMQKLFDELGIEELDILHSDIDGSEVDLLKEVEFFEKKNIGHIFLLAHGNAKSNTLEECKSVLMGCGYNLNFVEDCTSNGSDSLLLFTK